MSTAVETNKMYAMKVECEFIDNKDSSLFPFPLSSTFGIATTKEDAKRMIKEMADDLVKSCTESGEKTRVEDKQDGWVVKVEVYDIKDDSLNGLCDRVVLKFGCLEYEPNVIDDPEDITKYAQVEQENDTGEES